MTAITINVPDTWTPKELGVFQQNLEEACKYIPPAKISFSPTNKHDSIIDTLKLAQVLYGLFASRFDPDWKDLSQADSEYWMELASELRTKVGWR